MRNSRAAHMGCGARLCPQGQKGWLHMAKQKRKLLVADNVAINRMMLRGLFEKDYDVLEAETGAETLRRLAEYGDEISI